MNQNDIKSVQKVRPDLSDEQSSDVLGFLCDVYDDKPYTGDKYKQFEAAADYMFPEVQNG